MKKKNVFIIFFILVSFNLFPYEKTTFSKWTMEKIKDDFPEYLSEPITEIYTLDSDLFIVISESQHAYLTDNKSYLNYIYAYGCSFNNDGQPTSTQLQPFRLGKFYTYILDCNYDGELDILNYAVGGIGCQIVINSFNNEDNYLFESNIFKSYKKVDIIFSIINGKRGFCFKQPDKNNVPYWSFYYWSKKEQRYILDKTVTQEQIKNAWCPEDYFAYNGLEFSKLDSKLTAEDLRDLDKAQLRLMRNAVYARHGRTFKSVDLQSLWECYTWYKKNPNYSDSLLTDIDKYNIELIQKYEQK